jgi:hypothetical protein
MSKRDPGQVYADLVAAGFSPDQATVMTAIAGAESGYDDQILGDLGLQNAMWGPSFGLYQIRTLKADTGSGSYRDITRLASSDAEQAKAAYAISGGGRDFTPWSVFTSGAYQQYLNTARTAAASGGSASSDGPFPTWGPDWLPWNWPSLAANSAVAQGLAGGRGIVLEVAFVGMGLALLAAGTFVATRTVRNRIDLPRRLLGGGG